MCRASRIWRRSLPSQRKGRAESGATCSRLIAVSAAASRSVSVVGPGFHNANHIQVVGRMIDLRSDEAIVSGVSHARLGVASSSFG